MCFFNYSLNNMNPALKSKQTLIVLPLPFLLLIFLVIFLNEILYVTYM